MNPELDDDRDAVTRRRYLDNLVKTGHLRPTDVITVAVNAADRALHLHPSALCSGEEHTGAWADLIHLFSEGLDLCQCVLNAPTGWPRPIATHELGALRWAATHANSILSATFLIMTKPDATGNPTIDALVNDRARELRELRDRRAHATYQAVVLESGAANHRNWQGTGNALYLIRYGSTPDLPVPEVDKGQSSEEVVAAHNVYAWVRWPMSLDRPFSGLGCADLTDGSYAHVDGHLYFRAPVAACTELLRKEVLGIDAGYNVDDVVRIHHLVTEGLPISNAVEALHACAV